MLAFKQPHTAANRSRSHFDRLSANGKEEVSFCSDSAGSLSLFIGVKKTQWPSLAH